MNAFFKYLHHQWFDNPNKWYPLTAFYYLTNACDFRCPYCSDGSGTPYYKLSPDILSGQAVISLLKVIRQHSDSLFITGGEPLNHPDFAYVMENIGHLRFKKIILTTNGYRVDSYLDKIAKAVQVFSFSLDTLNYDKADAYFGIGKGILEKILANIEIAKRYKNYQIAISSVVMPNNIEDLYDVYHYAQEQDFLFAAAPQLIGVKVPKALINCDRYRKFYNFLISERRKGRKIFGSITYLEYMRDLPKFTCHPFTMLVVSPVGDVFYPCLEIGHFAGNLLKNANLHQIRREGERQFGPQPHCDTRCHSGCALAFSIVLHQPFSIPQDIYLTVKGQIRTILNLNR